MHKQKSYLYFDLSIQDMRPVPIYGIYCYELYVQFQVALACLQIRMISLETTVLSCRSYPPLCRSSTLIRGEDYLQG